MMYSTCQPNDTMDELLYCCIWLNGRKKSHGWAEVSKEDNEKQQKGAIQEEYIQKNKRTSLATKTDVSWMEQFVLPPKKTGEKPLV